MTSGSQLQAKYAYRSIAEFVKHVTRQSAEHLARNPFPELHRPPSDISDSDFDDEDRPRQPKQSSQRGSSRLADIFKGEDKGEDKAPPPAESNATRSDVKLYKANEEKTEIEVAEGNVDSSGSNGSSGQSTPNGNGDTPNTVCLCPHWAQREVKLMVGGLVNRGERHTPCDHDQGTR